MIKLQIIIPTYNRLDNLCQLLYSIDKQKTAPNLFVNVVIFDNSDNNLVSEFISKSTFNFKLNYNKNKSNIGLIKNLNKCYLNHQNISSDYIWILGDDDVLVTDDVMLVLQEQLEKKHEYYYLQYSNVDNDYNLIYIHDKDKSTIFKTTDFIENELINCGWIGSNIFRSDLKRALPNKISNEYFPHISILVNYIIENKPHVINSINLKNKLGNRWEDKNTTTWSKNYVQCVLSYVLICNYYEKKVNKDGLKLVLKKSSINFLKKMGLKNAKSLFNFYKSNSILNLKYIFIYIKNYKVRYIFLPFIFNLLIIINNKRNKQY